MKTIFFKNTSPLVKTVWAVHIDAFYVYVMIRATSIIHVPSKYKRVSGTCAFIAFTRAPGIGLKDRMHRGTYYYGPRREKT